MKHFRHLFALIGTLQSVNADSSQLTEPTSKDNSAECSCYLFRGADAGYFQYYRFWDFRNLSNDGLNTFNKPPPLVTNSQNNGGQNITSSYFNSSQFTADWTMLSGPSSGFSGTFVNMVDSFQNVFIGRDNATSSTYLAMRAARLDDFVSIAELDSNQANVLHASIRTRMRVVPYLADVKTPAVYVNSSIAASSIDGLNISHPVAPGAVVGIFTYRSDTQESDIEILTSDPTANIRYSNQPDTDKAGDAVPNASTDQVMPQGAQWTEYHEQRLDWFDGISRWYVDGDLALEKTVNVPNKPSALTLNVWSNGGSWSGNMTVGAQVVAAFEWIEMAFNISGNVNGQKKRHARDSCNVGCSIDNVTQVGFPTVAFNTTRMNGKANGLNAEPVLVLTVSLLVLLWTCVSAV